MKHCRCTVSVYGVHWQGNVNVYLNHDKNFFASISEGINLFTEVCEGNVFTGVCLSTGRGVCIGGGGLPRGGLHQEVPGGGLHPGGLGRAPLGLPMEGLGSPLPPRHMGYYWIWSTSRQYTSYYNAFLLYLNLPPPHTHTMNSVKRRQLLRLRAILKKFGSRGGISLAARLDPTLFFAQWQSRKPNCTWFFK